MIPSRLVSRRGLIGLFIAMPMITVADTIYGKKHHNYRNLPKRQFEVGDYVRGQVPIKDDNENDVISCSKGYVVGYIWNYTNYIPGWTYWVDIEDSDYSHTNSMEDFYHESELTLV